MINETCINRYTQQGLIIYSTGDYIQYPVTTYHGKESEKKKILYITESLCCTPETNTAL